MVDVLLINLNRGWIPNLLDFKVRLIFDQFWFNYCLKYFSFENFPNKTENWTPIKWHQTLFIGIPIEQTKNFDCFFIRTSIECEISKIWKPKIKFKTFAILVMLAFNHTRLSCWMLCKKFSQFAPQLVTHHSDGASDSHKWKAHYEMCDEK